MADRLTGYTGDTAIKVPCRLATTAAITLSGEQTIDGVAAVAGDRVLVKNQADTTANGIYIVSTSAWARSADWDGARDVVNGTQVAVASGTANAGLHFAAACTDPFIVGAALTFTEVISNATLSAATGAGLIGTIAAAWTTVQGFITHLATSAGSSVVGFIQAGTGAIARTIQAKSRDVVNAQDYDTLANAFAAADHVVITSALYPVIANTTIAISKKLTILAGGSITVSTGVTLTINGEFSAPVNNKIFYGLGSVVGIRKCYPEWWGAVGDGVTNDQAAFQACTTSQLASYASTGGKCITYLGNKNYGLSSPWIIYETANIPIDVEGSGTLIGGTRLIAPTSYTGAVVVIEGSSDSVQRLVDFTFRGVAIITTTLGSGTGLLLNSVNTSFLSGLQESLIEDVYITGFQYGISAQRIRLINFNRVSVWNDGITVATNYCVFIKDAISGTASFSGDCTFTDCQFVGLSTNANSYGVRLDATLATSSISGIRFNKCIFYKATYQLSINTVDAATAGDIWVTDCQFDGPQGYGIYATQVGTTAGSYITDLHIANNYFTACSANAVRLIAAKTNGINSVDVSDNYSAGTTLSAVYSEKTSALVIVNNRWTGCSYAAGAVITIVDGNHSTVIGNNCGQGGASHSGGFTNMINFAGTANYLVCTGNNSAGLFSSAAIANTTGAANTAIANNI